MSHTWIRVVANPLELKVVKRCAGALGIHVAQATGHLVALWGWLSKRSDTGDVSGFSNHEIEEAAGWTGKPDSFAQFVRDRHTDTKGRIRDWEEFMGPMVRARVAARERQRGHRERLRKLQDQDADNAIGGGGSNGKSTSDVENSVENSVTRDSNGQFVQRNVRRDTRDVTRDIPELRGDRRTEVRQNKELRTTGMYLGSELELVSSESKDELAISSYSKNRDASALDGIALVRAWSRRFYRNDPDGMLDALKRIRATLRHTGLTFQGQTIRSTPLLVVMAMNETLAHPPREDDKAIVLVLKKLQSGHLHEVRAQNGELVTEAAANTAKAEFSHLPNLLREIVPNFAEIGKSMPGQKNVRAAAVN